MRHFLRGIRCLFLDMCHIYVRARAWWHQAFSASLALCEGNQQVMDSSHEGTVMRALVFYLVLVSTKCWTNNRVVGDWDAIVVMWLCSNDTSVFRLAGGVDEDRRGSRTDYGDQLFGALFIDESLDRWVICMTIKISNSSLPQPRWRLTGTR